MERIVIECNSAGVLETVNFHVCYFGDITEEAMNGIITTMTSGVATTIAGFNNLSQTEKHTYLKPYFSDPAYSRSVKIHSKSLKTNGAELGADADQITEVSGSDGQTMDILFAGTEYGYGWIIKRMISGSNGAGYDPSEYEYQDLHLHNAGFQISNISGCVYFSSGSATGTVNTAGGSKNVLYRDTSSTSGAQVVVNDGYPRKQTYSANGNILLEGDNNSGGSTIEIPKAVCKRDLICFGGSFKNVINDQTILNIVTQGSTDNAGMRIQVSGGKMQFQVQNCVSITCDGGGGRPNINSSDRFWFMFVAHDTQSFFVINGITQNVMRTGGVTPLTKDYWINTILDAASTFRVMRGNGYGFAGTTYQWEFSNRFIINNTPNSDTITKITAAMNRVNLI